MHQKLTSTVSISVMCAWWVLCERGVWGVGKGKDIPSDIRCTLASFPGHTGDMECDKMLDAIYFGLSHSTLPGVTSQVEACMIHTCIHSN